MNKKEQLQQVVEIKKWPLNEQQIDHLIDYIERIQKWGKVYNLTAVLDDQGALVKHVLDCLSVAMLLADEKPKTIIDVGSGGGLPGLIWALACPYWQIKCVDAVAKKAAFVQHVIHEMPALKQNLTVQHGRIEHIEGQYDWVISRAFASLKDFVSCSRHLLSPSSYWLAMKGKVPDKEIQELPSFATVFHVEPVKVPYLLEERCLVWLKPA